MPEQLPTIDDVARQAGVSASTVSRVMNRKGNVRAETHERVLAAVANLGYVPSGSARALRGKPAQSVALLVSDVANPFYAAITRGVEDVAQSRGYSLIICNADRGHAKQHQYLERLRGEGVRGMIIAPAKHALSELRRLSRDGIALVIVDWRYPLPNADNVYADSIAGARLLVEHLVGLGHERIAVISGPRGDATAEDRVAGYRLALEAAGIACDAGLVRFGRFAREHGRRSCLALLAAAAPPTAVLTCNNRLAAGAYEALVARGLRMPEDIRLVSFDDVPFMPALAYRLTLLAQPDYEMGRIAAELLFERLSGERGAGERRDVVLQGHLVIRDATDAGGQVRRRTTEGQGGLCREQQGVGN